MRSSLNKGFTSCRWCEAEYFFMMSSGSCKWHVRTIKFPKDKHLHLQEWELLILQKLRWELSSTTAMDYLDHVIPRLYLPKAVDVGKLRRMTESVISYASMEYFFTYRRASLLAATSLLFSLQQCVALSLAKQKFNELETLAVEKIIKDARTCLQILTHTGSEELEKCCLRLSQTLPDHLVSSSSSSSSPSSPSARASPDSTVTSTPVRQQDYTSAVDVFSDFSVLEAVTSILVTWNRAFSSITSVLGGTNVAIITC